MPEWLIVAIKEYLFVKETYLLKKFASLISWPPLLESQQSWIIKIGVEFIKQVSLKDMKDKTIYSVMIKFLALETGW